MTTTKKLAIAVFALSLALVCAIGGTLAFLVADTEPVTNTFTYGEISISLWENVLDENGDVTGTKDYDGIEYGKIVPGDVVNKNPTVTVTERSEACYVYVLIDNQLGEAASYNIADKWTEVGTRDTKILYRYSDVVDATASAKDLAVFTTLTFENTLTKDEVAALKDMNVVISAYAHQSKHVNEGDADTEAIAWAFSSESN